MACADGACHFLPLAAEPPAAAKNLSADEESELLFAAAIIGRCIAVRGENNNMSVGAYS